MQSLQDAGEPAARCHPTATGRAAVEVEGFAKMPVMPEGPLRTAGAHDQADQEIKPYKWVHPDEER